LGPNHPDTLTSRNNLARAYQDADRLEQAIDLFEQNLTDSEHVLGPNHPWTTLFRDNLARVKEARN
ncbi:tetratricopeptide repeat protein, partial [uncultured Actinomyces sp.]